MEVYEKVFYKTDYHSSLGELTLVSDGEYLVGLCWEGQKYFLHAIKGELIVKNDLEVFARTKKWIDSYFGKKNPSIFDLPIRFIGSSFQNTVWNLLCEIPYGQTITYGELAKNTAKKMNKHYMSAQATGGAVGKNPISIIVPCHRVLGSNRSLTGYAGGIDKKIKLLELEGIEITSA